MSAKENRSFRLLAVDDLLKWDFMRFFVGQNRPKLAKKDRTGQKWSKLARIGFKLTNLFRITCEGRLVEETLEQ